MAQQALDCRSELICPVPSARHRLRACAPLPLDHGSSFDLVCRYQHYDYLIGIGGGIGFTPFMSILKHFLSQKRGQAGGPVDFNGNGVSRSTGNVALFYGVCRSFDDVAWWASLTCAPDFSSLVTSCSTLINKGAETEHKALAAKVCARGGRRRRSNSTAKVIVRMQRPPPLPLQLPL